MPSLLDDPESAGETTKLPPKPHSAGGGGPYTTLPNGIVLDKDGKPCKTCTSSAAWKSMMKTSFTSKAFQSQSQSQPQTTSTTNSVPSPPALSASSTPSAAPDCPPDVEELGNATWTLLHTMAASYPPSPPPAHQRKMYSFMSLFSQFYPCGACAEDFQDWMTQPENDPTEALKTQEGFGRWMCRAHNAVNVKLGKKEFDCNFWKERWRDGWKDGRCD